MKLVIIQKLILFSKKKAKKYNIFKKIIQNAISLQENMSIKTKLNNIINSNSLK